MSRPLCIEIENGIYHITSRGWERRLLLRDDGDREHWFELLDRVAVRLGWRFFAWALMDNHFHLLLETPQANLSAGRHDLNSGYATWVNCRHRRVGSLFPGRFKAILVEDESYLWTLSRYIHLMDQIELAVTREFGVPIEQLHAKRVKGNDARLAALHLLREMTGCSAPALARRYGDVSPAAISKAVARPRDGAWRNGVGTGGSRGWHDRFSPTVTADEITRWSK